MVLTTRFGKDQNATTIIHYRKFHCYLVYFVLIQVSFSFSLILCCYKDLTKNESSAAVTRYLGKKPTQISNLQKYVLARTYHQFQSLSHLKLAHNFDRSLMGYALMKLSRCSIWRWNLNFLVCFLTFTNVNIYTQTIINVIMPDNLTLVQKNTEFFYALWSLNKLKNNSRLVNFKHFIVCGNMPSYHC